MERNLSAEEMLEYEHILDLVTETLQQASGDEPVSVNLPFKPSLDVLSYIKDHLNFAGYCVAISFDVYDVLLEIWVDC